MTLPEAIQSITADTHSRMFVMDDWMSKQYFWKQFLSGVFIVIVMTGLDQDMMQKNLTCKSLRDAQKDMCTYGVAFVPANLLFLSLGVLLVMVAQAEGLAVPVGDHLLPDYIQHSGLSVVIPFTIGLVAASFSSADSALTSLTTSYCVDIQERAGDEQLRKRVHLAICVVFIVMILLFRMLNSTSVIDAIYVLCGYTYGPLLGLFAFGMLTKRMPRDQFVPYICIASPMVCYAIDYLTSLWTGYKLGYELLMLNGLLTFMALAVSSRGTPSAAPRNAS
jgi:Na+/proline symporter